MKILLVNPNPLGLEYLSCALQASSHQCRILDLCFAEDPAQLLEEAVTDFKPQIAGLSIRNIDTALFHNNIFFLDEFKAIVTQLEKRGVPVVLGGAGFSFNPQGVLSYLEASWGISGPGERALVHFLDLCEDEPPPEGTLFEGWSWGADPGLRTEFRDREIDYQSYTEQGGIAGFETQKGCLGTCSYCAESTQRVIFRNPRRVVEELKKLVERGITEFHLCDSEFNQNLDFCHEFLETLLSSHLSLTWSLYMKSSPYDEELFRLLSASGARLVTLSLPSGPDGLSHAGEICRLCRKYRIRLAVDYLCGFPEDTPESVKETIETLRRIRPDTVGVNSFIRLYPGTEIADIAEKLPQQKQYFFGETAENRQLIRPVFYSSITTEFLRELIGDDPLFTIEGFQRSTNYERIKELG